eukprot:11150823-Alexandrium_andersonii.AAC.1
MCVCVRVWQNGAAEHARALDPDMVPCSGPWGPGSPHPDSSVRTRRCRRKPGEGREVPGGGPKRAVEHIPGS